MTMSLNRRGTKRRRRTSSFQQWLLLFCFTALTNTISPPQHYVSCFAPTSFRRILPSHDASTTSTTTALFGIKGFRVWFESQFPEAILSFDKQSENAREEFDHVLVDVNQLLHVALRRSRSEGHALTLFIKELDACFAVAVPKRSVVLAMDGPPSAAKLATQRRRRFSTVVRTEWKKQQLSLAMERGSASLTKRQEARKRRAFATETKTLCITPGTDFMLKAHQAVLYWAWQRLSNTYNPISRVRIYFSPSTVPGEGEVKLLDWLLQHRIKRGESIAILGGDSDLVLEGLVIPPSITHNVFVLLPEESRRFLSISLWETTRALSRFLPKLDSKDMMRVRTDLVLLLIMNGNDYLPKLRGSAGFNNLFHNYLRILHQWLSQEKSDKRKSRPFLVDPDSLEFNLPFCLAYFRRMAQLAPENLFNATMLAKLDPPSLRITPLSQLNNMVDSGFMPRPLKWTVLPLHDDNNSEDVAKGENGDIDGQQDENQHEELMRLSLGEEGTEHYYVYEKPFTSSKRARQQLASLALEDIMGEDFLSFGEMNDDDEEEEMEEDMDEFVGAISNVGYAWEVTQAKEGKCDRYLGGLLWNLQTYQDGICADYAYNYGRRMSPTAKQIVAFLREAMAQNRTLGPRDLLGEKYTPPVRAGLSCLAALPSQVYDLIPEPYSRLITDNVVEEIYADCMDPEDNVFDMKRFERLCEEQIQQMNGKHDNRQSGPKPQEVETEKGRGKGRRILLGDHYWTVISRTKVPVNHPFQPPEPFSDRLSYLKQNRRLQVSRVIATSEPTRRSAGSKKPRKSSYRHHGGSSKDHRPERKNSDMGPILENVLGEVPISNVGYKQAYQAVKNLKKAKRKKVAIDLTIKKITVKETKEERSNGEKKKRKGFDMAARMKKFKVVPVPSEPVVSIQGFSAMQILQQLLDCDMIGSIDYECTIPSQSRYAAISPQDHENIKLVVRRGASQEHSVLDEDLTYEQDRHTTESRRAVKQHLASFALCDVIGSQKRWTEMRFKEIKTYLMIKRAAVVEP